ncbi:hypothetical protein EDD22DRAFT_851699 [Suillus occidentalis]|nr:hypothetical protein EDD22DRAFT_851699 [Suillus occidentalis]
MIGAVSCSFSTHHTHNALGQKVEVFLRVFNDGVQQFNNHICQVLMSSSSTTFSKIINNREQDPNSCQLTFEAKADKEVWEILDLYYHMYEELFAVPVIPGIKSEKEEFASFYQRGR